MSADNIAPIIIKRKKVTGGDGHHGGAWKVADFQTLHYPEQREKIRFTNAQGKLRNQLDKTVPKLAGQAVQSLYEKRNLTHGEPQQYITHGGGRDVIEELERVLPNIPQGQLGYPREIMAQYGNMSSPSVLAALELFLADQGEHGEVSHVWMTAFGAGFSAHSCQLYKL